MKINSYRRYFAIVMIVSVCLSSCDKVDVFERNAAIPGHKWSYNLQPSFEFTISDTIAQYNLYVVLRHTDNYRYNNIWLNIGSQSPADSMLYQRFEFQLGNDARGWEGSGMDDIWELRKPLTKGPVSFKRSGTYKFSVAQVMRENPLPEIMSVGIRVEKAQ